MSQDSTRKGSGDMDYRKLFQVLVVGGAVVGGATACNSKTAEAAEQPKNTKAGDAGTAPADAGTAAAPSGGGVRGW